MSLNYQTNPQGDVDRFVVSLDEGEVTFMKKADVSLSTFEALTKYTGNYRWLENVSWEGYRQTRKFSHFFIADGKLKVRYTGNYVITLTPVGKDIFYYKEDFGAQFKFQQPSPNKPMSVTVTFDDGFPGETMAKDTEAIWQPSKEILTSFTGKYYSKHLDYFWNIVMNEDGKLVLKRNTLPDAIIEPDGLIPIRLL